MHANAHAGRSRGGRWQYARAHRTEIDLDELWRELRACFGEMSTQFTDAFRDTGWTRDDVRDFVNETMRSTFAGFAKPGRSPGSDPSRRRDRDDDINEWQDQ